MARAFVVVGLQFGDEGKGSIVDSLTRTQRATCVVRFNGGAQAAHHVVTDDGRAHCFSQFGSGTLAGARTFLSRHMLLDPLAMEHEAARLAELGVRDPFSLVSIDQQALVITPHLRALNRLREMSRGAARHGSCGVGFGETVAHALKHPDVALRVEDFGRPSTVVEKVAAIQEYCLNEMRLFPAEVYASPAWTRDFEMFGARELSKRFDAFGARVRVVDSGYLRDELAAGVVVFEGAQGVLLDQEWGFHPYTTWSDTTFGNALTLLGEANVAPSDIVRLGVMRAYMTRHGAGPLPTEGDGGVCNVGESNGYNPWQQGFRVGALDGVLLKYALRATDGVDGLAVTCLDHAQDFRVAMHYDMVGPVTSEPLSGWRPVYRECRDVAGLLRWIGETAQARVCMTSNGPTAGAKRGFRSSLIGD